MGLGDGRHEGSLRHSLLRDAHGAVQAAEALGPQGSGRGRRGQNANRGTWNGRVWLFACYTDIVFGRLSLLAIVPFRLLAVCRHAPHTNVFEHLPATLAMPTAFVCHTLSCESPSERQAKTGRPLTEDDGAFDQLWLNLFWGRYTCARSFLGCGTHPLVSF